MIQYLIEMTVYDPALPGEKTLYFSTHGYTSTPSGSPPNQHYARRILEPGNYETTLFASGKTYGQSRIGFGEVRLHNPDGGLDHLIDYGFDGRTIVFKTITKLGVVLLLASCTMEQAEFNDNDITIRIKDQQAVFATALQPTKYAGTNVLPAGIEGTDDIEGKPKPLTFGKVFNVTPVMVNTSRLIYQVHTGTVTIDAVYDKGVALAKGDDYSSQAEMEATAPAPGYYRAWPAGGCFRLGSSPVGAVACDATEGATAADRTAAQIAKRIAVRVLSSGDIDSGDLAALDAANSAEVGIYTSEETTIMSALDQVLGSVGAWYALDHGVLRMAQFTAPGGVPDFTLDGNQILGLERIASNDAGRGIPAYKVNLSYARNCTVQTSDLAGSVQTARDLSHWTTGTIPEGGNWTGIAYGNGTFVAVDGLWEVNKVITSPDGSNWTLRTLPASRNWKGIAYGNGLFVAVAYNSTDYATSVDGVTWTLRTLPSPYCIGISFGSGRFILPVFGTNTILTSTDGITWTTRTMPTVANWINSAYGNGIYVVISSNSDIAATSADGVTWTQRALPSSANWQGLVFGNGVFVATEYSGKKVATSQDGITWTGGTLPGVVGNGIAYGRGLFIAVGDGTSMVSDDGVSWLLQSNPSNYFDVIGYGDCAFVMLDPFYSFRYTISPASQRVQWLGKEYRTVTAADVTVRTRHLLAPEMNITTLLVDYDAAQAEAARLLLLYKSRRDTLKITVDQSVLQYVQIGKVGKITYNRYGYDSGKLFRVIGVLPEWQSNRVTLTLWG